MRTRAAPTHAWTVALLVPLLLLCGDLGATYPHDQVTFDALRHAHFDALGVDTDRGQPSSQPLVVRVHLLGDAAEADLSKPIGWLREHANVQLVPDERGVPLYLTYGDLAATSGRSTLGATIPSGMAVEMARPKVGACVLAHETLHFLGLRHDEREDNIMYRHCTADMLDHATLDPAQRDRLDRIEAVRALTPRGVETWAGRG